jgi:RND superfamily putative drug exporter
MQKFGDFIVKRRWFILLGWVVAAVLIVALAPPISSIQSNDQSSFLPKSYESVKAGDVAKNLSSDNGDAPTDLIIFKTESGAPLTQAQQDTISGIIFELNQANLPQVKSILSSPEQLAPSKKAQLATVTYEGNADDEKTIDAVKTLRDKLNSEMNDTGLDAGVTGGESISYDTQDSAKKAEAIVGIGTILLVILLPAFIFRSPLAGLLPVLAIGLVFSLANALISIAGHVFDFHMSQQLSILFTVVMFGIGTDYILFLLFRYRERLRTGDHTRGAVAYSLSRAGEAIFSAALVVLTSFVALFFADFGIFKSLAPGLVICVAVMMFAALTLVPALVSIIGEKIFWPSKAWMVAAEKPSYSKKIGKMVARVPGRIAGTVIILLAVCAFFAFSFKADFSSFSQPPKNTPSADAYNDLTNAFPPGVFGPPLV